MNKSERERLASIVSEMKTSFSSSPEVVVWGERILAAFPSILTNVQQFDDVQKIENVASSYSKYIVGMSCSFSKLTDHDREVAGLGYSCREDLYYVFDEYFCHDDVIPLEEIEDELGAEERQATIMVKRLLADEVFIQLINRSEDLSAQQKVLLSGK